MTVYNSTHTGAVIDQAVTDVIAILAGGVADTITGQTLNATGDTSAADNAAMGYTAVDGVILTGQGSTNDVTIKNDADENVIGIPTGTKTVEVIADGNIGIGTTSFGTSGTSVLGIAIGTEPTTEIAGQIAIYSKDSSAGATDATLALNLETDPVVIGTFTESHKIPIWVNQVEYHISLDQV